MAQGVKILPYYTYNDYVQWKGKWELIDGIPYAMRPAPTPMHQINAANLSAEFRMALKKCKHCNVSQPIDYKIEDDTVLQPDMLVVCGKMQKQFLDFPPALVAEILSPSTALKDRHSKFSIYEREKILFYLILSPESEEVEIYSLESEQYVLKQKGTSFSYQFIFAKDCSATIDFSEIWK